MPAVDVAMRRSLRRGFLDLMVASLRPALQRRDLQEQISDVRTALSSWDNCMQVEYCKYVGSSSSAVLLVMRTLTSSRWSVIGVIIVGGLIIISVIWCIIRCACCGRSCCCSCFSCLKCCGNCCGCCDPPRRSRHKYLDEPYIPPHHGYKSHDPMHAGFGGPTVPAAKAPDYPQYAEFETSKKDDDALPQMPSWEDAESKKVLVEEEGVEMDALKKPEAGGQAAASAMGGAAVGTAVSPNPSRSPVNRSPFQAPGGGSMSNGYYGPGTAGHDPYAQGAPAYNQPGMAYSEADQPYGMTGTAMGSGRRSPNPYGGGYSGGYDDGSYGQALDYPPSAGQGNYGNYGAAHQPYDNYDNYGSQADYGYGMGRVQSPRLDAAPYHQDARRSPAPQAQFGGYGPDGRRSPGPQGDFAVGYAQDTSRRSPGPQAEYGGGYDNGPYGAPQQQYASDAAQPLRSPRGGQFSSTDMGSGGGGVSNGPSPLRNDAGFDFTSGYSRPQGPPGGYRQPSPAPEAQQQNQENQAAYTGYKPYKPAA